MPVQRRLIIGTLQRLKEKLLEDIAFARNDDPFAPVVVLVGSNLVAIELQRSLAEHIGGHVNVSFITLKDLARRLGERDLLKRGREPLPSHGDELIVRNLAAKIPADSYFHRVAGTPGFPRALLKTFNDLREGGFDRWPLGQQRTNGLARAVHCPPDKLMQLASLFDDYRNGLSRHYDTADLLVSAAGNAGAFARTFGTRRLLIYGIYDFNAIQQRLIQACARCIDVVAYVPQLPEAIEGFTMPTLEWFEDLGFSVESIPDDSPPGSDLERLQQYLLDRRPDECDTSDGTVELISAPGDVREVREIVRRILGLAAEGMPFHRMAILLRQPAVYAPLLADLFERLGIPFFLRHGPALSATPAGRSLKMLLQLAGSGMSRFDVMEFLCGTDVPVSRLIECDAAPPPAHWDRISRRAGIVAGQGQWYERLTALERQLAGRLEREIDDGSSGEAIECDLHAIQSLRQLVAVLFERLAAIPERGSWAELSASTADLFESFIEAGDEPVADAVRDLASLDAIGGDVGFEMFRDTVVQVLEAPGRAVGKFSRNGVCICDLLASRGLRFDAVFIPGLVEKSFPAPARQDPILLDSERALLNKLQSGGNVIPSQRHAEEEAVFLALAVAGAEQRIVFSFPRLDTMSGSERIPSSFVLRIAEALAGRRVDYGGIESLPWRRRVPLSELAPANRDDALDAAEYDLSSAELAVLGDGSLGHLSSEFTALLHAARADERRWGCMKLTAFDGCIGPTDPQTRLLSQGPVSPTRLEQYARCPFRYFVSHVLRVVELDDPDDIERISPLERGSLAHRVLEQFFREQKAKGRLPLSANDRDDLQAELRRIFALHSTAVESRGAVGYPLFWRIDRETLLNDLIASVRWETEQAGDLVPDDFEVRFGGDGSVAFEIEAGRSILFKGRIDRVDVSSDRKRARVIDYKTGKTDHKDNAFAGGRCLQLPVYLLAARAISGNSLDMLEAEYRKVSPHQAKPAAFSGEALLERESEFRVILSTIAAGVAEGLFPPWPADANDCRWCSSSRICGANTGGRVGWKAENDPRTDALQAMRGIEDD